MSTAPETLGPYQIGEALGKGGMGAVYRGVHRETGDLVAVKVLSPRLAVSEGFRDRFEGEIESLKSLRHAGIVRLFGYGEQDSVPFFAMELVDGPSLEEELRSGRRFTWRETTQIAIQVCRALKHAHDHGVIHRDLKPANILLASSGQAKLADFGIARVYGSTGVTIAGGILGTADYMSPEQAAGKPVNARCDQYSLGGVMYALLAGRPPFRATDMPAMLQLHRYAIPEPVRRFAPDTPKELERIVSQLLEKEPADRFPNTLIVARRLEAMSRALSRPAADDFELYATGVVSDSTAPVEKAVDELAMAATMPAADLGESLDLQSAPTEPPPADDAAAASTIGSTYTAVDATPASRATSNLAIVRQAAGILLVLAAMAGVAWWALRPLTADQLYDRIAAGMQRGELSRGLLDDTASFARRFGEDDRAEEVAGWRRDLRLMQQQNRLSRLKTTTKRGAAGSAAEALQRRAALLAEREPAAAIESYESLAELLSTPTEGEEPSADNSELADVATREAQRLRAEMEAEAVRIAEFAAERLVVAQTLVESDPSRAHAIATAVIRLLPASEATREVLAEASAIATQASAKLASTGRAPVAPTDGVR